MLVTNAAGRGGRETLRERRRGRERERGREGERERGKEGSVCDRVMSSLSICEVNSDSAAFQSKSGAADPVAGGTM